jgi:hypothetical protein
MQALDLLFVVEELVQSLLVASDVVDIGRVLGLPLIQQRQSLVPGFSIQVTRAG